MRNFHFWITVFWVAALMALTLFLRGCVGRGEREHARILLVGVRGLSWQVIADGIKADRFPGLSARMYGESAKGDIISTGYHDAGQILDSVITGKFAYKQGNHHSEPVAIWDHLGRRGDEVGVVGFPLSYPLTSHVSLVFPEMGIFLRSGVFYAHGKAQTDASVWPAEELRPVEIPAWAVEAVTRGKTLSPAVDQMLRRCLIADFTAVGISRTLYEESSDRHVFLYLSGLYDWQNFLRSAEDFGIPEEAFRLELVSNYYDVVDRLLSLLTVNMDDQTLLMVFSEDGNRGQPIRYRPYFPPQEKWPTFGFFLACGYGVKRTEFPHILAPVDLAATLLYMAGVPIPNSLDSSVLFGMLKDEYYYAKPVSFSP